MFKTKRRYEVRRVGTKANYMWVVFKMLSGGKELWWFAHPSLEMCLDPVYNYPTAKVVWSNPEDEPYTIEGFLRDPNCRLVKA
jgi:hypothetical protein